ncbi:response regulator transcription factor [uncultured Azohydromonas sp.]|jgi:Response regulator containing CheY-like receiver domain and AraC-type DNA-binding domain|uniref:response regulator n=1 Tax=uncultured Azohydromonas sp. TaxID=487342 RepID=UPI00262C9849|nr:response regulator transcription factor [uncultured Azohydromonas sp.]
MSQSLPLSVLVVDDHPGLRTGLTLLINAEFPRLRSAGAAANGAEALQLTRRLQPDVVLLDVQLGGEDGLALIPLLQREAPCRVVVLTALDDARVAQRARLLGASEFTHKTAPAAELMRLLLQAPREPGLIEAC